MGTRTVPFSRVLYIERDDFRENPPRSFTAQPRLGSPVALCLHHQMRRDCEGRAERLILELRCTL